MYVFCNRFSHLFAYALFWMLIWKILPVHAQTCNSETVSEVIFSDLTILNSAYTSSVRLAGDASISTAGTALTSLISESFGGLFFNSPTDFQGSGGFSLKFSISASGLSSGVGTWEAVIASESARAILPPPFGPSYGANGLSGWSRSNALVIELDTVDSGPIEQDDGAPHVAVFLSGTRQCTTNLPFQLNPGSTYTIWVDYNGFTTTLETRVGAAGSTARPTNPTLSCVIDIWSTLSITTSTYVGFTAYGPSDSLTSAIHYLNAPIAIADAYRPYDGGSCISYARCALRESNAPQCVQDDVNGDGLCEIVICAAEGYVWDVSGEFCCAFIEKGAWIISAEAGQGPFPVGQLVPCIQTRRIVAYRTDESNCG